MKSIFKKLFFPIIGFLSLIWFLIRVIPKPSRATYPCMRAAAPLASSFIIYLLSLFSSIVFFKKAKKYFVESRYVLFTVAIFVGLAASIFGYLQYHPKVYAHYVSTTEGPNMPMGFGKGINPGRVAWIHDPDATNENCTNSRNDYWYMDKNTNQEVVNSMVSRAIQMLTDTQSNADAWDALFRYFNKQHGKGDVGYTSGEKIAIKINLNGINNSRPDGNINTSPQTCYAILDQLVNVVGVAQKDISLGDPNCSMNQITYTPLHSAFPNVTYWGNGQGLTWAAPSANAVLFASDGSYADALPQAYIDAAYLINMPVLKKHHRAGISLTAKNHFGSIGAYTGGAWHLHPSLPCPDATGESVNTDYGIYRCFVDIMGHKDLGGKTVLFLIDGIWGSTNWGHPPIKWRMAPFNNDWPSSVFASQDEVAIQSVGFDFLFYEFDENHPTEGQFDPQTGGSNTGPYPHFAATDDFLHQTADSLNWPAGIIYDPENDGVPLPRSLGVHEHWNNAIDKQYSRNLGANEGIELVSNENPSSAGNHHSENDVTVTDFTLYQNYPNPFNMTTAIRYSLSTPSHVQLNIYATNGQKIRTLASDQQSSGIHSQLWDGYMDNGSVAPSGLYVYQLTVQNSKHAYKEEKKMMLVK
jgi:hypothetical protein